MKGVLTKNPKYLVGTQVTTSISKPILTARSQMYHVTPLSCEIPEFIF